MSLCVCTPLIHVYALSGTHVDCVMRVCVRLFTQHVCGTRTICCCPYACVCRLAGLAKRAIFVNG